MCDQENNDNLVLLLTAIQRTFLLGMFWQNFPDNFLNNNVTLFDIVYQLVEENVQRLLGIRVPTMLACLKKFPFFREIITLCFFISQALAHGPAGG